MESGYPFEVINREDGAVVYNFLTKFDVGYSAIFYSTQTTGLDSCFESPTICENGYIFAFMRVNKVKEKDENIIATLLNIIEDFIKHKGENCALFYTCDSGDNKHFARKRIFEQNLFYKPDGKYIGSSITIEDPEEGKAYCLGCFFSSNNKLGDKILQEFDSFSRVMLLKSE